MIPKHVPPAVATFLACCDEVIVDESFPTLGTALLRGKLTLILGSLYLKAPNDSLKIELLKHEIGHFALGHISRRKDRYPIPWNLVCDAAIHMQGICDWERLDRELGIQSIIYERLPAKHGGTVPPTPPEIAYDLLEFEGIDGDSCGSISRSSNDDSVESRAKMAVVGAKINGADRNFLNGALGRHDGGETNRAIPEIPPPPPWTREVLEYLLRTARSHERNRSWRREHRALPDILPGRSRSHSPSCRVLLDASGSINEELIKQFLGALVGTPELSDSDVVVFDHKYLPPVPAKNAEAICKSIRQSGGGTGIAKVGNEMRPSGIPVVWLTDCESGDGFPEPHDAMEIWCVHGNAKNPHGVRVNIDG